MVSNKKRNKIKNILDNDLIEYIDYIFILQNLIKTKIVIKIP